MKLSLAARTFITLVVVLGLCVLGDALVNPGAIHPAQLAAFLVVACLAARLKVKLPGLTGSMSVNLPFILIAAVAPQTSMLEALAVACVSNLVQCLPRANQKFSPVRAAFNVSTMALAVEVTRMVFAWPALAPAARTPEAVKYTSEPSVEDPTKEMTLAPLGSWGLLSGVRSVNRPVPGLYA